MSGQPSLIQSREMGTRVTACDVRTGESETVEIVNDYVLTTDGECEVASIQTHANGTHVITVKGVRRG